MCGIFGAVSNQLIQAEREHVQELGMMASLRGIDSAGLCHVYTRKNKTKWGINRDIGNSVSLLTDPRIGSIINCTTPFLMMGHARAATVGTVNEHNAHPIKEGPIIGCHNGTIWKWGPDKKDADTSSDSRVLFRRLGSQGLQATLEEAGGDAAYALSWVDLNQMTFNLIRNNKRPLFVMWNTPGTTMYWASERGMLCWLAERNASWGFKPPESVPEHVHIRLRLGTMSAQVNKLEIKPKVERYGGAQWDYCGTCWMQKSLCQCSSARVQPAGLLEHVFSETKKALGLEDEASEPNKVYLGYNQNSMSLRELEHRIRDGCCNCLRTLDIQDKIFWVSRTDPVCEDCLDAVTQLLNPGRETLSEGRFLN